MAFRVFFDANVILDLTLERNGFTDAESLFTAAAQRKIKAFTSASVIQIASYWMTKAFGVKETKDELLLIMADVEIIDLPHHTLVSALQSSIGDIEDAMQYFAALHHKINYFITADKKMKKEAIPLLPIFTPKEFLKQIN